MKDKVFHHVAGERENFQKFMPQLPYNTLDRKWYSLEKSIRGRATGLVNLKKKYNQWHIQSLVKIGSKSRLKHNMKTVLPAFRKKLTGLKKSEARGAAAHQIFIKVGL